MKSDLKFVARCREELARRWKAIQRAAENGKPDETSGQVKPGPSC